MHGAMQQRSRRGSALMAALALLLPACGSAAGDAQSLPVEVRSGTTLLFEEGPYRDPGALYSGRVTLHVLDAVRDADDVFVAARIARAGIPLFHTDPGCIAGCTITGSTAGDTAAEVLFVSRDAGATWETHPLPLPPHGPTGGKTDWHQTFGLHASGGRAVHVVAANGDWTQYGFVRFDPQTLTHVPTPDLDRAHVPVTPRAHGDAVTAWGQWTHLTSFAQNFHSLHLSLTDWKVTSDVVAGHGGEPFEGGPPLPWLDLAETANGLDWVGVGAKGPWCRWFASASGSPKPFAPSCIEQGEWPRELAVAKDLHAFSNGTLATVGTRNDRTYVRPLEGALVDLGPGRPATSNFLHPQFGGAIRVQGDDGEPRYVDLRGDGPVELLFPNSPCAEGRPCGASRGLAWALPMGEGEWLLIHLVDAARKGHIHYRLYASRQKVSERPLAVDPSPVVATSPIPFYPTAIPAGPLERACHARAICFGADSYYPCVSDWTNQRPGCAALEAFLAVDPAAEDACLAYAGVKTDPACAVPDSATAPPCTQAGSFCADDTHLAWCAGAEGVANVRDCTLTGHICGESSHAQGGMTCVPEVPDTEADCGNFASYEVECHLGRYLSFCSAFESRHWLDCTELGSAGCESAAPGQHAACSGPPGLLERAVAASEIERRCWGEVKCHPKPPTAQSSEGAPLYSQFATCVGRWTSPLYPESHLADFLAAAPDDCDALRAADPIGFPSSECAVKTACSAPDRSPCAVVPGLPGEGSSCALDAGTRCTVDVAGYETCIDDPTLCTDPTGQGGGCDAEGRAYGCAHRFILDCPARGMTCVASTTSYGPIGHCVDPAWSCADASSTLCDGDTVLTCDENGIPTQPHDCARVGLTCGSLPNAACVHPDFGASPPSDWPAYAFCGESGELMYWYGGPRRLECGALGGACAEDGQGWAWCE